MLTEQPQIWHYGLVAQDWAEFNLEGESELTFFQKLIVESGQPALDLGCGSGRLLIPLLQAGLDVDGCDYSEDMLAVCRQRLQKEGLSATLVQQSMHNLDLPKRYRTIFACGVIGLGGSQQLAQQAMQRAFEHLRVGGVFAFDYSVRWNDPPAWLSRLPEARKSLPQEWPESSNRRKMSDGCELESASRTIEMDPLENIATRQLRHRLWRGEELVKEEIHTQKVADFTKNELVLMLQCAGFKKVHVFGEYSAEPATPDHNEIIFVATQ